MKIANVRILHSERSSTDTLLYFEEMLFVQTLNHRNKNEKCLSA